MNLGFGEILLIFIVILLLFGAKKLPELGRSLGTGFREFKKAMEDAGLDEKKEAALNKKTRGSGKKK